MSQQPSILLLDDEASQRRIVTLILQESGYEVTSLASPQEALRTLESGGPFELVLSDLRMPAMDGIQFLERVRQLRPEQVVIVITAHGSIKTAVEAMQKGAFHYLTKPLDRTEFLLAVQRGVEHARLLQQNRLLRQQMRQHFALDNVVGRHPSMQEVFRLAERVAPTSTTVMLSGESGTGKELIARAIHQLSPRAKQAMQAINCAAIPESLLESELFGHEKGAFTGADALRKGLFEQSDGTTLLLDEIGDLDLHLQGKILRVIQEREVQRLGGSRAIPVDVRIISTTHRDLAGMVEEGKFRQDLFYRLNTFPIRIPPLRERANDIPLLVNHFIARLGGRRQPPVRGIESQALSRMTSYPWPGNVRELESAVERAIILAEGSEIRSADLPPEILHSAARSKDGSIFELPSEGISLQEVEKSLIQQAMNRAGGVLSKAAPLLGLSFRTLQYRLKKYELR